MAPELIRGCSLVVVAMLLCGCTGPKPAGQGNSNHNVALAKRIAALVDTFLTADDDAKTKSVLAEARAIFERHGIPSVAVVGDGPAYGFVLINVLGQPAGFRTEFMSKLREAAARHELPEDAVTFAEARQRQTEVEQRFKSRSPSDAALRDNILRLLKADQAVRQKDGFDARKMSQMDRELAAPLRAIFERHGVPTYEQVGVEAAKGFLVMVQHQPAEFRQAVLPKLKANIEAGQGDASTYAMVYDRAQRDQGKKQLYGEQFECSKGEALEMAPLQDESGVDARRAQLGLMRVDLHARLVRLYSPDVCGSASR